MAVKEPYVSLKEIIVSTPSTSDIDDNSILAGVIDAPCGPDYLLVHGPREFLSAFTSNGSIARNADTTLINAYYCSFFAPLLLKRAWKSKVVLESDGSVLSSKTVDELPNKRVGSGKIASLKYPVDLLNKSASGASTTNPQYGAKWKLSVATLSDWNNTLRSEYSGDSFEFLESDFNEYVNGLGVSAAEQLASLRVVAWRNELVEGSEQYRLVSLIPAGVNPLTGQEIYWEDIVNDDEDAPMLINLAGLNGESQTINILFYQETATSAWYNSDWASGEIVAKRTAFANEFDWFVQNSDVYNISYISAFGFDDSGYAKTRDVACNTQKWFQACDEDEDTLNVASSGKVTGDILESAGDTRRSMAVGSRDKNASVTPWKSLIAASSLYWQKVYENKASNSEFAPVFDITNGVLAYQSPIKEYNKKSREYLLNATYPINWVKYDRTNGVYYFNNNLVHTRKKDVMNEEMNVRMINKIERDILLLLPRYKGMLNNDDTRLDVYGLIDDYFKSSIMNQNYRPVEYMIICDRSNNTDAIINANKLAVSVYVRIQGSIKYIEVINKVFPLGVDFES